MGGGWGADKRGGEVARQMERLRQQQHTRILGFIQRSRIEAHLGSGPRPCRYNYITPSQGGGGLLPRRERESGVECAVCVCECLAPR